MANLLRLLNGLPTTRNISAAIDTLLGASDEAAARAAINAVAAAAGTVYGYKIFQKTDTQVSSGVASQAAVDVTGWKNIDGTAATPDFAAENIGDLIVVRFTAGTVAHDENIVNVGIAVKIGGTLITGDASSSRTSVGSNTLISLNSVQSTANVVAIGADDAATTSPIAVAASMINQSAAGGRTLYLNRSEGDLDSQYSARAISTLEVWGVRQ